MGLEFVWHPECPCGVQGPWPVHEAAEVIPGRVARVKCRCSWTATGRYVRDEYDDDWEPDEDFMASSALQVAKDALEEHEERKEERRCKCSCHMWPSCTGVHADRRDRLPRRFTCEHSPLTRA
jgi:hypothetical protein